MITIKKTLLETSKHIGTKLPAEDLNKINEKLEKIQEKNSY